MLPEILLSLFVVVVFVALPYVVLHRKTSGVQVEQLPKPGCEFCENPISHQDGCPKNPRTLDPNASAYWHDGYLDGMNNRRIWLLDNDSYLLGYEAGLRRLEQLNPSESGVARFRRTASE